MNVLSHSLWIVYCITVYYFICRLDIDSNIGVKISIFGPDETTTDGTSKISDILPSTSLCEDDVANGSQSKTWKFITNYIFGHNERLRFIVLQKQNCSRWGPLGKEDIIAEFFNWLLEFQFSHYIMFPSKFFWCVCTVKINSAITADLMSSFSHDLHISGFHHHALQYAQYYQCSDDSHINAHNENNKRFSRSDFFLDWMDLHHNIYLWQRNITFLLLFWIFICWIGQGKSNNITKVFTHLYLDLKCILLLCTNFNFSILPSYHQKYLFYGKFLPFSQ